MMRAAVMVDLLLRNWNHLSKVCILCIVCGRSGIFSLEQLGENVFLMGALVIFGVLASF